MISISKLTCGAVESFDNIRYGESSTIPRKWDERRPVAIINVTRKCNLHCVHCYADADETSGNNNLTTGEWMKVLEDLARFGCPVVLFSGGEPLLNTDVLSLITHAVSLGLHTVISTNGTVITPRYAEELSRVGVSYIGVSLDGTKTVHDSFRQSPGSFDRAIEGLRNARDAGIKTGMRFTITKRNVGEIPAIFDIVERERIPRICFYHLVYTGRAGELVSEALSHGKTRAAVDTIIERTRILHNLGNHTEVLTVDNHCDGPYLYLKLMRENSERAFEVMKLLERNGGNSSGVGVSAIGWDGAVYPDQFWRNHSLGNVREHSFGDIWTDRDNTFLMQLKTKKDYVKGRCATCRFLNICGGNFRARAEAVADDIWAPDPACYLTDEEIEIR